MPHPSADARLAREDADYASPIKINEDGTGLAEDSHPFALTAQKANLTNVAGYVDMAASDVRLTCLSPAIIAVISADKQLFAARNRIPTLVKFHELRKNGDFGDDSLEKLVDDSGGLPTHKQSHDVEMYAARIVNAQIVELQKMYDIRTREDNKSEDPALSAKLEKARKQSWVKFQARLGLEDKTADDAPRYKFPSSWSGMDTSDDNVLETANRILTINQYARTESGKTANKNNNWHTAYDSAFKPIIPAFMAVARNREAEKDRDAGEALWKAVSEL